MTKISDKDKEMFSSQMLEMRKVCYEYARLCCYMLIIVNSLAISKVVDLLFTSKQFYCIESLKMSLYLFVGALFFSFLTAFSSYFVQSLMMTAGQKYWNEVCHLNTSDKMEFNRKNTESHKRNHKIPNLLNILTYIIGFISIILFVLGVIIAVENI